MTKKPSKFVETIKNITKKLFLSKLGWVSIILANFLWSMFWFPFVLIGLLSNDGSYYGIAFGIYLFFAQPLIPMWIIIPLTAWNILKLIDRRISKTTI